MFRREQPSFVTRWQQRNTLQRCISQTKFCCYSKYIYINAQPFNIISFARFGMVYIASSLCICFICVFEENHRANKVKAIWKLIFHLSRNKEIVIFFSVLRCCGTPFQYGGALVLRKMHFSALHIRGAVQKCREHGKFIAEIIRKLLFPRFIATIEFLTCCFVI
jgi:hypothetical protein